MENDYSVVIHYFGSSSLIIAKDLSKDEAEKVYNYFDEGDTYRFPAICPNWDTKYIKESLLNEDQIAEILNN